MGTSLTEIVELLELLERGGRFSVTKGPLEPSFWIARLEWRRPATGAPAVASATGDTPDEALAALLNEAAMST